MYSSDEPAIVGARSAPLPYGLKARMYQVWHFGHCTQWRMRSLMVLEEEEPLHTASLRTLPAMCRTTEKISLLAPGTLRAPVRLTIDISIAGDWTFADSSPPEWTFPDAAALAGFAPKTGDASTVRKRPLLAAGTAIMSHGHGTRSSGLFAGSAFAGCAL
jgi:hypothetical protein